VLEKGKKETETVEKKEVYPSLDQAMKSVTEWGGLNERKLKRIVSPPLFAFLCIILVEINR
jgi:hypothetical protein